MPGLRGVLFGPWRAVPVLAVTQILAWGAIYYTPVLTVPLISAAHGWSTTFAMAGFSLGLLVTGLLAPRVGSLIDRHGGQRVMPVGSLLGAAGLVGLALVSDPAAYLAVWAVLGTAMAASLYDPAFATLGRIFGVGARRAITLLTFAGGFASTVSWPATHLLIESVGWQNTYLVYAALLVLVAAPLHAFALPRDPAKTPVLASPAAAPTPVLDARGPTFLLVVAAFATFAFVPSGLLAHLLAMFQRHGIDAATAVTIGALFGPSQVGARLCEFIFARDVHPLVIVRFAVGVLLLAFALLLGFGFSVPVAAAFVVMLGLCNGLITIGRGTVPLALFGAAGYGRLIGRISRPSLAIQASAPLLIALIAERVSDLSALVLATLMAVAAFLCFLAIPRPAPA
jgi:MFS family permease